MPRKLAVLLQGFLTRDYKPQVETNYLSLNYLSRERWISYWYQLMEVMASSPTSVLEIGPGPNVVSHVLKKMGLSYTSLDIDWKLRPRVVADVTKLPFTNKSFDTVLAAQVLEHIPFTQVPTALGEIARVSRRSLVITLPHYSLFSPSFALKLFPFVPRVQKVFSISILSPKHRFDGQHYWEIGKRDYSFAKVLSVLRGIENWKLSHDYIIEENPYHHVFVLNRD